MPIILGGKPQSSFADPFGMLSDCHRRIEMFLNVLVQAAALGVTPLDESSRKSLAAALDYFRDAAPRHTADEEESVFPRLRECGSPEAAKSLDLIEALQDDHVRADELHRKVDELGRRWLDLGTLDAEAMAEFGKHVESLRQIYAGHIALEDERVFPAARKALGGADLAAIGREMARRRGVNPSV